MSKKDNIQDDYRIAGKLDPFKDDFRAGATVRESALGSLSPTSQVNPWLLHNVR
jgi:hypothetical protein